MKTTHVVAFGFIVTHLSCPVLPQRQAIPTSGSPPKNMSTVPPLIPWPISTNEKITTRTLPRPVAPSTAELTTMTLPTPTSTRNIAVQGFIQPFFVKTRMPPRSTKITTQKPASATTTAADFIIVSPFIHHLVVPFFMLAPTETSTTPAKILTDTPQESISTLSRSVISSISTKPTIHRLPPITNVYTSTSPKPLTSKTANPFNISVKDIPMMKNQSQQLNSSFKISGNNTSSVALFGLPAFCSYSAVEICSNIPLKQCKDCTMVGAGFFVLFVVLLGVAIICSNAIIILLFVSGKSTFTGTYGKIKVSLAFADLLTGLLLFFVAIPNFSKTINSSPEELLQITLASVGSPEASVGGVFFILLTTSSLYHLVLLAEQRLYAVKWPIKYKQQSEKTVYTGIAIVWALALIFAVAPLFFPKNFSFTYQQLIFLFSLTLSDVTSTAVAPLIGVVVVVYLVPYLIMSCFTLATAVYIRKYIKKGSEMRSGDAGKREVMVFRTMAIMQLGFTITMIPLVVIISTSYAGVFTPYTISAPYIICFFLSMSNSLVNVLVYSAMDAKFRKSVRSLFVSRRSKTESKPVASSGSKDRRTYKSNESTEKQPVTVTSMGSHHQVDTA